MGKFQMKAIRPLLLLAALLVGGFVVSTDSSSLLAKKKGTVIGRQATTMAWTPEIMQIINAGDPQRGKALAKEHRCKKCHGKTGISDENDTPNIAGLPRAYAFKQMFDYKNRRRHDKSMRSRCQKITLENIADLAAWFETQKMEPMMGVAASKTVPELVNKGDMSRLLLPCRTCHNKQGTGRGQLVPRIGGQKREHFVDMMMAYKEAERTNDDYGVMRFIAERLSDDEIEQLALYYGSRPIEEDDD